jgi:hypothetical protein
MAFIKTVDSRAEADFLAHEVASRGEADLLVCKVETKRDAVRGFPCGGHLCRQLY